MPHYSEEPKDHRSFTERFDRFYTRFATIYDVLVKAFPTWKKWLRNAIPQLIGPRILEVSLGTGWLMMQYADSAEVHGVDLAIFKTYRQRTVRGVPFPPALTAQQAAPPPPDPRNRCLDGCGNLVLGITEVSNTIRLHVKDLAGVHHLIGETSCPWPNCDSPTAWCRW